MIARTALGTATLLVLLAALGAAPAFASSVSNVAVDNATPSNGAGARTRYAVEFTTSATGGLSQAANSRITVSFPAGATFAGYTGGSVFDLDANQSVGSCSSPAGQDIQCSLFGGASIAAGHDVEVTFNGITNPTSAGQYTVDVSTTADTTPVTSPQFSVAAADHLTAVSLDNSVPSNGAGARTRYQVLFTTSATGGMSQAANSRFTVTFPSGTTFGGYTGGGVIDVDANDASVGSCSSPVGLTITCSFFGGASVAGGHQLETTFNGVTNPPTPGSYTVDVSTTSDTPTETSSPVTVAAAGALSGLSVVNASPSDGAGARTRYAVRFTTSATGGMSQAANSRITVTFPAGTTFGGYTGGGVVT